MMTMIAESAPSAAKADSSCGLYGPTKVGPFPFGRMVSFAPLGLAHLPSFAPSGLGRSSRLSLGVGEEGHEAEIHVELLVAVEEG